ncbi:hypothetical protein [Streptomyces sp. NPDC001315]|uniref:hypothetical protein n=1 Tax=Streptomyces sp. NPDC001315 TaxID=3364562 RepID=UPI00369D8563
MANPPGNPNQHHRGGNGKYQPSLETAQRNAEAARLRTQGYSHAQIAEQLNFPSVKAVSDGIRALLQEVIREPGEELLKIELARLDAALVRLAGLEAAALKVLEARHITVNNGKVILHPDTEQPLDDDGPVLQAVDRLIKIEDARQRNAERRAKLLGLDAEQKVNLSGSVKYEVVGINSEDLT